jgi:hypothetical protein
LETDGVGKRCKSHKQEGDVSRRELRVKRLMQIDGAASSRE